MIDRTAIIHPSAQIANNVSIGPYVIIGKNVEIDEGSKIIANCYIEHAKIGKRCTISPFSTIGSAPQDLSYNGEKTNVIIGDDTIIKENVTIHRASSSGDFTTRIGNKCLLMVGSHVAHNCVLEDEVIMANLATIGGHVHVGFGAFLGGMTVFHQNIRIGDMVIVSGFAASRQDLLPYTKYDGRLAKPVGINVIALKRRGIEQATRSEINSAYKLLVSEEYNTSQAIEKIREEISSNNKYVEKMVQFIKDSKRGVCLRTDRD